MIDWNGPLFVRERGETRQGFMANCKFSFFLNDQVLIFGPFAPLEGPI